MNGWSVASLGVGRPFGRRVMYPDVVGRQSEARGEEMLRGQLPSGGGHAG